MQIFFVGDIMGRPGREFLYARLRDLRADRNLDLVVANCENAASGFGVTPKLVEEILEAGVDVLTSGNHVWDRKEIMDYFPRQPRLLRPANYPDSPGSGLFVGQTRNGVDYAVLNVQGRVFLPAIDCPFKTADRELARVPPALKVIVVDIHGETTSEKMAMGWYLNGRVSAVIGTHTHVQTADERLLPGGTAYITDVGMTGPQDSIIGMERDAVLRRFLTGLPARFEPASGDVRLMAVLIEVDEASGRALSIERISLS